MSDPGSSPPDAVTDAVPVAVRPALGAGTAGVLTFVASASIMKSSSSPELMYMGTGCFFARYASHNTG